MNTTKIKSFMLATACMATLLASCDMDKYPYDKIPVDNAMESLSDCQNLRNGMYRDLRIIAANQQGFLSSEMQADCIVPTNQYGNQWSSQYLWAVEAADEAATTVWNNNYVAIAQCNMLIGGIQRLENEGKLEAEELAEAHNILGEAYMMRAMCYFDLATRYCNLYDETTAGNEMGVPLVETYAPSADNSTFPGRSTLEATYQFILKDIENAKSYLTTAGTQEAIYLTTDALTAFEARVALLMGNYDTAITNATSLINSQKYPLISNPTSFANMWKNDTGTELICQLYADRQESVSSMGEWFLDEVTYTQTLLPADDIITMYGENDIRLNTFFSIEEVNFTNGAYDVFCISKYPGNPELNSGSVNQMKNKVKIFRIPEMYLVAAEAYYMKGGTDNEAKAYDVLYQLMSARDASVQKQPVQGNNLRQLIRDERLKELCYEGFRWLDLKRYGEGFTRMAAQADELSYNFGLNLKVSADDPQWLWPIPQDEIEANPQIKGQQNPGY